MEDYTQVVPVMETVANPNIATAWPDANDLATTGVLLVLGCNDLIASDDADDPDDP